MGRICRIYPENMQVWCATLARSNFFPKACLHQVQKSCIFRIQINPEHRELLACIRKQTVGVAMQEDEKHVDESDKHLAAVCGLYCEACSWFIATHEDPERLKGLAARFNFSEEESRCCGCRSDKRLPYCQRCKMFACAAERGIDY